MGRPWTETESWELVDEASEVAGRDVASLLLDADAETLRDTRNAQLTTFVSSLMVLDAVERLGIEPSFCAGHSLGEYTALTATGALSFEDGLKLVSQRALAMQKACEIEPSTMAAVLGLPDATIEDICKAYGPSVVAANFNCPGQVVISGSVEGIEAVGNQLKEAGAKRVLPLPVGGAFHSPYMEPARLELAAAIEATEIVRPICPIFQKVNSPPSQDPAEIKANLISQLTAAVRWTQSVEAMVAAGATEFIECGPGKVLQGLVRKVHAEALVSSMELE
jgi:[acyl-carrier-protein] S-malonyltransferase